MGVKSPNSADRRVKRTRRVLREALISLIIERGWDRVSVQDVCDRADVGRSTFYTHFADKEELLIGGLDDLRKTLRARRAPTTGVDSDRLGFALGLIEHAEEHERLFRAIVGKGSGHMIETRFRQMVIQLVHESLGDLGPGRPRHDAVVRYVAGAFVELLTWWLTARDRSPPSEIESLFRRLTMPVLETARRLK